MKDDLSFVILDNRILELGEDNEIARFEIDEQHILSTYITIKFNLLCY